MGGFSQVHLTLQKEVGCFSQIHLTLKKEVGRLIQVHLTLQKEVAKRKWGSSQVLITLQKGSGIF